MSPDWYVVCRFTTVRRVNGENVPWVGSEAHAKRMGGTTTACGTSSVTMAKLFGVSFPVDGENCPDCLAVVTDDARRRRPGSGAAPRPGGADG